MTVLLELERAEAQNLLAILTQTRDFQWAVTNPLILKLAPQLQPGSVEQQFPSVHRNERSANGEDRALGARSGAE